MERLEIRSVRGPSRLILSDARPPDWSLPVEYVTAELAGPDLPVSSSRVYLHDASALAHLFVDLAATWRDGDGTWNWHSVERDFDLTCTSDGLGHVTIQVTLRSGPYPDDWTVSAPIYLNAHDLDTIASQLSTFLHV